MAATCKVYPSAKELGSVNTCVKCSEEGCQSVFSSGSNLQLHLIKTHKKSELMKSNTASKEYHCPEIDCMYHKSTFFKTLKLLKQHYLKVHGEKKFGCTKCEKGFPTEVALKQHRDYCGVEFKCRDCDNTYPCYETLRTHCRRKRHSVYRKTFYKPITKPINKSTSDTFVNTKPRLILPKSNSSTVLLLSVKKDNMCTEIGTQTDIFMGLLRNQSKQSHVCVETQTIGDCAGDRLISNLDNNCDSSINKSSIKTQTKPVNSKTKSCNTNQSSDNSSAFGDVPTISRSSSSTQTICLKNDMIGGVQSSSQSSIGSDEFGNKATFTEDFDDPIFFNCNTETQTDIFGDEWFNYSDYYSNMCTQTCEDIFMAELGFNDNHTQTPIDDVRSVESQTTMSHAKRSATTCRDMANMQTQTELEFKRMLEEINA